MEMESMIGDDLQDYLVEFLATVNITLMELESAVGEADVQVLSRGLRRIREQAQMFGANTLRDLAEQSQSLVAANAIADVAEYLLYMRKEYSAVREQLSQHFDVNRERERYG